MILPSIKQVDVSIWHIQDSIDSHESWLEYRLSGGKEDPFCGDIEHHKKCLIEYAQVIQTLRTMQKHLFVIGERTSNVVRTIHLIFNCPGLSEEQITTTLHIPSSYIQRILIKEIGITISRINGPKNTYTYKGLK